MHGSIEKDLNAVIINNTLERSNKSFPIRRVKALLCLVAGEVMIKNLKILR